MDSLTQIVLGAAVGEVAAGKKLGNRAMLWGAIGGTIPDLDVYLRFFTDPVSATEMHRGISHSLIFAVGMAFALSFAVRKYPRALLVIFLGIIAAYPVLRATSFVMPMLMLVIFGVVCYFIFKRYSLVDEASKGNWWNLFFWSIVTHPLLDAHTNWGTQFFWPFEYRLAYNNIFVVDPLYTLPFLIFLIMAMRIRRSDPRRAFYNKLGLIVSSSYMALTLVFKGIAHHQFAAQLEADHIEYVELDTQPTPLNSLLWSAQVQTKDGFRVGYYSLFDSQPIQFSHEYPKNEAWIAPYRDQTVMQQLLRISKGWYMVEEKEGKLYFVDLRFTQMGFDPDRSPFLWRFELKENAQGQLEQAPLQPRLQNSDDMKNALGALWTRMWGN
jgi:inner membrane protein